MRSLYKSLVFGLGLGLLLSYGCSKKVDVKNSSLDNAYVPAEVATTRQEAAKILNVSEPFVQPLPGGYFTVNAQVSRINAMANVGDGYTLEAGQGVIENGNCVIQGKSYPIQGGDKLENGGKCDVCRLYQSKQSAPKQEPTKENIEARVNEVNARLTGLAEKIDVKPKDNVCTILELDEQQWNMCGEALQSPQQSIQESNI